MPFEADRIRRAATVLRDHGWLSDTDFDQFLPRELRVVSSIFWSRLAVARRAAEWITELGVRSVVDVGSGAGKFCVAAALATDASYVGIEQRPRLVQAASDLAARFGVTERARFICGTFGAMPLPSAEAYYFFNPFGENVFRVEERLDSDVELGDSRYLRDIATAERLLDGLPGGTYLITYNGFGGEVPRSFREVRVDRELPSVLRMWRKT